MRRTRFALALAALMAWSSGSTAQTAIVSDGRLPTPTAVSSAGDAYTVSGGTVRGTNLFHSFTRFNVPTSGSATFDGPASIENVLSRVTGGEVSMIDGLISTRGGASPMPSANFFLINPSGVMFGPNASLDIGGAFHASTADYLRLADGTIFAAAPAAGEVLTSALPQAFGFLASNPASISLDGSQLVVDPGQTLSLIGGNVQITNGAVLGALGGVVQVISVASPGEVVPSAPDFNLSSFSRLGEVTISGPSGIVAGGDFGLPGGTIIIRSGRFILEDGAALLHDTYDVAGAPIGIDVRATESMILRTGALIQTTSQDAGSASAISIKAGSLSVTSDSAIESLASGFSTAPSGAIDIQVTTADIAGVIRSTANISTSGSISILASGTVSVTGALSEIFTGTANVTVGGPFAGDIAIQAGSIVLSDGGRVHSGAGSGVQSGRNLTLTAAGAVTLSGLGGVETVGFQSNGANVAISAQQLAMDSGFVSTTARGPGRAGDVTVNASSVSLTNGAQIATSSGLGTPGPAGSMAVNASGSLAISGVTAGTGVSDLTGSNSPSSGLFSTAAGSGHAGQILVSTPSLTVANGGKISVATSAAGNAGTITANIASISLNGGQIVSSTTAGGAGGAISLLNGSSVSITGTGGGLFSTASSTGNAGTISVASSALSIGSGGKISASTTGAGNAGTIAANVGTLSMSGGGAIESSTNSGGAGGSISVQASSLSMAGAGTAISSTAASTGNAGQVILSGGSANVADGARVSVTTSGAGNAGTITANVGSMTVSGGQLDSSTSAGGAGGAINLTAGSEVSVLNGGRISADSTAAGATGNVAITAGDRITMTGGSISTRALTSDGGNITLRAPAFVWLENSQITTSVQSGVGTGGNVLIDPQFVIINNSTISANAFGGPGGNITIIADNFLASPSAFLEASSALSTPGTILINSPENNLASRIAQLPRAFVDASRLMRGACSARREGAPSSFTLAGRGGVPPDADGYLPSWIVAAPAAALAFARLDDCAR